MKVSTSDGKAFSLHAETQTDLQFLAALDMVRHLELVEPVREKHDEGRGWSLVGYEVRVDMSSPDRLAAETARKAVRSLGDLLRIGLAQAAEQGHVRTFSADPDPQETLAPGLVQLYLVAQSISDSVLKLESMLQEVVGAHREASAKVGSIAQGRPA